MSNSSNAFFDGGVRRSTIKTFESASAAIEYAQNVITDDHQLTRFHVCVDPLRPSEFYLLVVEPRAICHSWLMEQGFMVVWENAR